MFDKPFGRMKFILKVLIFVCFCVPISVEKSQTGHFAPCVFGVSSAYAADKLTFNELYGKVSVLGIEFSEKLKNLKGKRVEIRGFMAPPLKPSISFFVLTQRPMSICPFCSSDADWPIDIIVVKLDKPVVSLPYDRPITVTGILELGSALDKETGFVSLIRIRAENIKS